VNLLFLEYVIVEFILISVAGFSLIWGNKGIVVAGVVITLLNFSGNNLSDFWYWEKIMGLYWIFGITCNYLLNRKTQHLRVIKVSIGTMASLFTSGLFVPFLAGLIAWVFMIVIPLAFTYREIPKSLYLQIIFKFIFSTGWLIIGNILY